MGEGLLESAEKVGPCLVMAHPKHGVSIKAHLQARGFEGEQRALLFVRETASEQGKCG